jgi:pimeloyl-ACP methyl ester carboxylesterase
MPYANSSGVRIYYEVEGQGPSVLLVDGFAATLSNWREYGFAEALKDRFQVILVDLRGRGRSDKPHNSALYGMPTYVNDLCAVLDDLDVREAIFWGYSFGGNIGLALAKYGAARFPFLIIGGAAPGPASPESRALHERQLGNLRSGMSAWVAELEKSGPLPSQRRSELLASDAEALLASRLQWAAEDEIQDFALPGTAQQCLVYVGERDGLAAGRVQQVRHVHWRNVEYVILPGLTHGEAGERSDLVLPAVYPFLERVALALATH